MESRFECRYGGWNIFCICIFLTSILCDPHFVCVIAFCAGTRPVRSAIKPLPNSTTGGRRWYRRSIRAELPLCATVALVLQSLSLPGYHLCIRHHKRAVLSAHSQVGQWCGWSKAMTSLTSPSCTCCPSHWPSVCVAASWGVSAGCTCRGLPWVTRWWSPLSPTCLPCLLPCCFAVCPGQGAEDLGGKQVWRGAQETGDQGARKQGLMEPYFVLCDLECSQKLDCVTCQLEFQAERK